MYTGWTRLVYYRAFTCMYTYIYMHIHKNARTHAPLVAAEVDEGLRDVLLEAALGDAPHLRQGERGWMERRGE